MPGTNGVRAPKLDVQEDERLVNKTIELLECEASNHLWNWVLTDGTKKLWIYERYRGRVTKVAEPRRCERCKRLKQTIRWADTRQFIGHKYSEGPRGAESIHIDGAPRLTKDDKVQAFYARIGSTMPLVDIEAEAA